MSKAIFLDVDGPMIPVKAYHLPKQTKPATIFDPVAVALLNKLIVDADAKLVISSTWQRKGRKKVVNLLRKNKIDPAHLHEDWSTQDKGRMKFSSTRSHEIKWWLDDHPEVSHYVAIDDENLSLEFVPNAVKADTYEGLSFRNYIEAKFFLDVHEDETARTRDREALDWLLRSEIWRLKREGEPDWYLTIEFANELFPRTQQRS